MASEEDVRNRCWLDWLKVHTTGFKHLHRYKGTLEFRNDELIFDGEDVKKNEKFRLRISLKDIINIHYGFDEVFKGREERAWLWNKPSRTFKIRQPLPPEYKFIY